MANITKYQTANGIRYRVRYRKPDGTQTDKRGFKRKIDAETWAAKQVTVAKAEGTFIDPTAGKATVGDLAEAWLAKKRLGTKPSYYDDLEGAWRKYVAPTWQYVPVSAVTREDAQQWVAQISRGKTVKDERGRDVVLVKPKSASVVIRAHGVLAGILDDAVTDRRIPVNPVRGVELPRKTKSKHTYLTAVQLDRLANACGGQRRTLVLTLGLCGMRWGECVGLTVSDIDFTRRRISISRSATQINRRIVVGTPKTHEIRTIMYPKQLDMLLRAQCAGKTGGELVFQDSSTVDGYVHQPHSPKADGSNWFARACDMAGVPRMTVHDLRHTAASLMVRSGANVKAVQRQLGHASAAMTLDVYADLFDDDLDALSSELSNMLLQENVGKMWANEMLEVA
ncbi:tyrosine-type recombinase/integrase [Bifidobacterium biavatii]|uniref:Integrase n=1 Tax=Bifidobacterium biavatii DSM 23969 TaxID=1437608 RepID=A0A086ZU57_9BIFI|nr:site-specific integrase [Bifidobacterium biavatii]KFI50057.1 integrase [Bifidobacterium biavatii DSM 23969]